MFSERGVGIHPIASSFNASIGTVDRLHVAVGRTSGAVLHVEGEVALRVAEHASDLALINQWVSGDQLKNALELPRAVAGDETARPLALTLRVANAKAVAARLGAGPRAAVTVIDPTHLRLVVAPSGADVPKPLAAGQRRLTLAPAGLIRPDAIPIQQAARRLAPPGAAARPAASRILAWVSERMTYEVTPATPDAPEILARRRGDCTEYAVLAVSLLRAAGIPAVLREGFAVAGKRLVAHAWLAYHDGTRWREADATAGQDGVGSGHIEVSVFEVLGLMSVGELAVTAVEATAPEAPSPAPGVAPPTP
jgi:hypothetical protein